MKTRTFLLVWWMLILGLAEAPEAFAQQEIPQTIAYQGYLTNTDGDPANGTAPVTFRLYDDDADGAQVWQETQPNVVFTDGVFSVHLGAVAPLESVSFDRPLWLSVAVAGGAELRPRVPLTTVPFALSLRHLRVVPGGSQITPSPNLLGGHAANTIADDAISGATISGGGIAEEPNMVTADFGTVGGGLNNQAGSLATVGGGTNNVAGVRATVAGGSSNVASGQRSTIGGGIGNRAEAERATVAGGATNTASGRGSTVAGGENNLATDIYATVGGGHNNRADGSGAMIPGGQENRAVGGNSLAAGFKAKAMHDGTFVWADDTDQDFASTQQNQFLIRAQGGIGIGTNTPRGALHLTETPLGITSGMTKDALILEGNNPLITLYGRRFQQNTRSGLILAGVDDNGTVVDRWGIVRQYFPGVELHFTFGDNLNPTQNPSFMVLSESAEGITLGVSGAVRGERLRATEDLGASATPPPGGVHRDNVVYAWAAVSGDGQLADGFGIGAVERTSTGTYRITLARSLPNGVSVIVTPRELGTPALASVATDGSTVDILIRRFVGGTFELANNHFYVQVVGRP